MAPRADPRKQEEPRRLREKRENPVKIAHPEALLSPKRPDYFGEVRDKYLRPKSIIDAARRESGELTQLQPQRSGRRERKSIPQPTSARLKHISKRTNYLDEMREKRKSRPHRRRKQHKPQEPTREELGYDLDEMEERLYRAERSETMGTKSPRKVVNNQYVNVIKKKLELLERQ